MKKNVAIIFGGANSEYEVSLRSTASVIENFSKEKYNLIPIGITKEGKWLRYTGGTDKIINDTWHTGECNNAFISPDSTLKSIIELTPDGVVQTPIDVIFPILHGKNGEDGTIQGLFELSGIPYVGCRVNASANAMDKENTHILLENAGIKTAKWLCVSTDDISDFENIEANASKKLGYPMFVKPARAGSSVGVSKAKDKTALKSALAEAFLHDEKVLIEECITGVEVECAVLGNSDPIAPVVGELELGSEFYDYEAKYISDSTTIHIPARIPDMQAEEIKRTSISAYKALGCTGLSRIDFFALKDGSIILNEINTMPGFTSISMYPKMITHNTMSYTELLDSLVEYALMI